MILNKLTRCEVAGEVQLCKTAHSRMGQSCVRKRHFFCCLFAVAETAFHEGCHGLTDVRK